ncbi:MAG: hypothetical protein IT376_00375 [Polyangiaceae bacterium]|nr:hypothetical protein [Polyangiaceae bacterium]
MRVPARGAAGASGDRLAWALVGAVALVTFTAVASGGRVPGVDLPQHALALRRWLDDTPTDAWALRWSAPYGAFYALAWAFTALGADPARGTWLAFACALAALPLASGWLARAHGASPAFGVLALLGAFGPVTAWGFGSLLLGAGVAAGALGLARWHADRPRVGSGAALAIAVVLTYASHLFAWGLLLPFAALTLGTGRGSVARRVGPLALGAAVTGALAWWWSSGLVLSDFARREIETMRRVADPSAGERLAAVGDALASYGRAGALLPAQLGLVLVMGVALALVLRSRTRAWSRLHRLARRKGDPTHGASAPAERARRGPLVATLHRATVPVLAATCAIAYLALPIVVNGVYLVYPRVLPFLGVALPACLRAPGSRALRGLARFAVVPALAVALAAHGETRWWDAETRCIDHLGAHVGRDPRLVPLDFDPRHGSLPAPLHLHLGAELVARHGGQVAFDFADFGAGVLVYAPGWRREVLPSREFEPGRYQHAEHGRGFDTWLVRAPRGLEERLLPEPGLEAHPCGQWTLYVRPRGPLGESAYLPHRGGS